MVVRPVCSYLCQLSGFVAESNAKGGLTTFYLLFVMELKTRRVNFAGCTTNPNEAWTKTVALELANHEDGFRKDKKYLIMDRDATFSQSFRACLRREGVNPVRLPPRSPNLTHTWSDFSDR